MIDFYLNEKVVISNKYFFLPRNDIGAVSVRAGCTFTGFVTTDFTGTQCVLRLIDFDLIPVIRWEIF